MKTFSVRLEDADSDVLEQLVREFGYRSKSHLARVAIAHLLALHRGDWRTFARPSRVELHQDGDAPPAKAVDKRRRAS